MIWRLLTIMYDLGDSKLSPNCSYVMIFETFDVFPMILSTSAVFHDLATSDDYV